MNWTEQQSAFFEIADHTKINAVAGSGKTTTLIEFARRRSQQERILYLAFNKTVKEEAIAKFNEAGLKNVKVETAHSLAFKHIIWGSNYQIKANGYKAFEIQEYLDFNGIESFTDKFTVAQHILNYVAYFCNSAALKVQELNYLDVVTDEKVRAFVEQHYEIIELQCRFFLAKMKRAEIEITHDFYLKLFQLQKPQLGYDIILFDEGQDASPAMLDIFENQQALKVIVGDTHQQIYSWRYAVNSLDKVNYSSLTLSNSFRFGDEIADLANTILLWKNDYLRQENDIFVRGIGKPQNIKTKAVLARSNMALLLRAIDYLADSKSKGRRIYFEGNLNSYTYAQDGASLYDILNLHIGNMKKIRDDMIKQMKGMKMLEKYIENTGDKQMAMMVEIVKKYDTKIPSILKRLKNKQVDDGDKLKADLIFSTVHKAKGMEYDSVELCDDFITDEKLKQYTGRFKQEPNLLESVNEEVNLLYVAITRAKKELILPKALLPVEWESRIDNLKSICIVEPKISQSIANRKDFSSTQSSHKNGYMKWTADDDEDLLDLYHDGKTVPFLAKYFNRSNGAIRARIKKLLGE